jgi:hypothetical protein
MRLTKLNNLKYRTPTLDVSDVEPSLFACASLAFKFTSTDDSDLNEVSIWRKEGREGGGGGFIHIQWYYRRNLEGNLYANSDIP